MKINKFYRRIQMKRFAIVFSLVLIAALVWGVNSDVYAQNDKPRASLKASVSQRIGVDTDIMIDYSRPGVKGRKIWGELVPYGFAPGNRYSDNKPIPWRAGANEATLISFSKDVKINGKHLAAGKYSIHMIPQMDEWTIMFNSDTESWGSYKYNKDLDVLTIKVKPKSAPHKEWLSYGFMDLDATSTVAYLHWEKLMVPFKVEAH